MTGWPVAEKCFAACCHGDESQQLTSPQVRHSRRSTQLVPCASHCPQRWVRGVASSGALSKCSHCPGCAGRLGLDSRCRTREEKVAIIHPESSCRSSC